MVKRRTHLLVGLCCALVLVALPAAASAQSCSTWAFSIYASTTSCNDGSSYSTACSPTNYCTTSRDSAPQPPVFVPPAQVPAALVSPIWTPADQGITINMDSGAQKHLARGSFVKIGEAPAIYWVYGAQLHSFTTWPQFLNAGGNPDLSNVTRFSILRDPTGNLFGLPVQP